MGIMLYERGARFVSAGGTVSNGGKFVGRGKLP